MHNESPDLFACSRCGKAIETQHDTHGNRIGVLETGQWRAGKPVCGGCLLREQEATDAAMWAGPLKGLSPKDAAAKMLELTGWSKGHPQRPERKYSW